MGWGTPWQIYKYKWSSVFGQRDLVPMDINPCVSSALLLIRAFIRYSDKTQTFFIGTRSHFIMYSFHKTRCYRSLGYPHSAILCISNFRPLLSLLRLQQESKKKQRKILSSAPRGWSKINQRIPSLPCFRRPFTFLFVVVVCPPACGFFLSGQIIAS